MIGISETLGFSATPLFTGSATNPEPLTRFFVSIGGHQYLADLTKYKRSTIDIMRMPQDGSDEPGEQSYTNVGIWRKHEVDWQGGAGQTWFDETGTAGGNPSNRQCFSKSKGINPWTPNEVSLLPVTELKKASAGTNMLLLSVNGYLYLADGTELYFTDNPDDMNLLSENDSGFETSVAGWVPIFASSTITQSTTTPEDGTKSMKLVATSVSNQKISLNIADKLPVTPLRHYSFGIDFIPDAGATLVNVCAGIDWYDASSTYISSSPNGTNVLAVAATYKTISVGGDAPINAAYALPTATVFSTTTGASSTFYFDRGRWKRGTSAAWTLPWKLAQTDAQPITSITTDGNLVYVSRGSSGVDSVVIGAAGGSNFYTSVSGLSGYANGFFLNGNGNVLIGLDAVGVATSFTYTHRNTGFVWNGIVSAPNGIYVTGNSNDHGEIYFIGIKTTDGTLLPPVYAGDIPLGESINTLTYYRGFMWLGTSQGLRMAQVGSGNELTEGALIPLGSVKGIRAWGGYLWASWSNYDQTSTGIARINPALFPIKPLAPAYASDLMVSGSGDVTSVEVVKGKQFFAVSGQGVFGGSVEGYLVSSGIVDSGWLRYGTFETKAAVSMEVRHAPLLGEVVVGLTAEDETNVVAGVSNNQGTLGSDLLATSNDTGEAFRMILTLLVDTTGKQSPHVRRMSLRAAPVPQRTDEIIIPLEFGTSIQSQAGEGQPVAFDPLEEWRYLKELENARAVVKYQEGSSTTSVVVDKVEVSPRKWTRYHDSEQEAYKVWFDGIVNVRLLTLGDS